MECLAASRLDGDLRIVGARDIPPEPQQSPDGVLSPRVPCNREEHQRRFIRASHLKRAQLFAGMRMSPREYPAVTV